MHFYFLLTVEKTIISEEKLYVREFSVHLWACCFTPYFLVPIVTSRPDETLIMAEQENVVWELVRKFNGLKGGILHCKPIILSSEL